MAKSVGIGNRPSAFAASVISSFKLTNTASNWLVGDNELSFRRPLPYRRRALSIRPAGRMLIFQHATESNNVINSRRLPKITEKSLCSTLDKSTHATRIVMDVMDKLFMSSCSVRKFMFNDKTKCYCEWSSKACVRCFIIVWHRISFQ